MKPRPYSSRRVTLREARQALRTHADPARARTFRGFFKHTEDTFLGVPSARVRQLARDFLALPLFAVRRLMASPVHEERSLAHAILVRKYRAGSEAHRQRVFDFYIRNRKFIHEWDGVDDSAPYIVGPHLLNRSKKLLYELVRSPRLWDRRIAMVSTWWFIRQGEIEDTLRLAKILLRDEEDLIHKATGWMLREVGKQNAPALEHFLRAHHREMPRTALRYAIERFPARKRQAYLKGKI